MRDESQARLRAFGDTRSRKLTIAAACCYVLMLSLQPYTLLTFRGEPISDAARYVEAALRCVREGHFCPTASDFIGTYTAANGYVNILVLLFRLTGSVRAAYWLNLLFVQILLFSVLAAAYGATRSADVCARTAIFFCLSAPYWSEICIARTELCFTALAFLALALLYAKRGGLPFVAGLLLAYANWVRPLGVPFFCAAIWILFYRRTKWHGYVRLLAGFAAMVAAICLFTLHSSGRFVYQPTIASVNLLIGANDDADGSYSDVVFSEGKAGYIPPEQKKTMIYDEIGSVYAAAAKEWILKHPGKYIALMPKKVFYLYATDTYAGEVYFDNLKPTAGKTYVREIAGMLRGNGRAWTFGDVVICWGQAFYMLTFALFLCGVIRSMRRGYWRSLSFLYGIFLVGTAMVMLTVGGGRYHFSYLPVLQITAATYAQSAVTAHRTRRKDTTSCGQSEKNA